MENKNENLQNMKTNIGRAVKKYRNVEIFDAINEAIINGIQANASQIDVKLNYDTDKKLQNIEIQDDGDGFNLKNRQSFEELYTNHKENDGCQGVGRLSYLKTFQTVRVQSRTTESEVCDFEFDTKFTEIKILETDDNSIVKGTKLILQNPIPPKQKTGEAGFFLPFDKLFNNINNHIYPYILLSHKQCTITINDGEKSGTISINDYQDFKEHSININDNIFYLKYRINKIDDKAIIDDFLCVNNRPAKHFKSKPLLVRGLDLPVTNNPYYGYHITFLLYSDWINGLSNEYHDIDIEEEGKNMDLIKDDNSVKEIWKELSVQLQTFISDILKDVIPNLCATNKTRLEALCNNNLALRDYLPTIKENIALLEDDKTLLEEARKKKWSDEDKINDEYASVELIQKCVKNDLTQYILHRQKIIERLYSMNVNLETLEKNIHNLILHQGIEGSDFSQISFDKNNLWLLDDKFMSYSYVASNKNIENLLRLITNDTAIANEDKPDIAIYTNNKNDCKKLYLLN